VRQLALDISVPPAPALESFVAGRNGELLSALERVGASPQAERFIYLWGVPGSGRTHLLRALASRAIEHGRPGRYVGPAAGADDLAAADDAELVCVDDVDRLDPAAQHALFVLINRLREGVGALVASGPVAPAGLALRADLVTRLGWGLVYEVHRLDDGEKTAAMQARARALGFELGDDACAYLLRHGRRDLPSLFALVDALDRTSLELRRPASVALAREVLLALDQRRGDRIHD